MGLRSGGWLKRLHDWWLDSTSVEFFLAVAILLLGAYLFGGWPYVAVGVALVLLIGIVASVLFVLLWLVAVIGRWL